jgi:mono/diheme cytochrome c family protein
MKRYDQKPLIPSPSTSTFWSKFILSEVEGLRMSGFVCAILVASPLLAQQDTKIENPFRGVMQDRTSRSAEERLYVEKCAMCHRQMGMGTVILARRMDPKVARLEARDDLTAEYVTIAVRQGIGNMPRIPRGEVSDAQLARIAAYLAKEQGRNLK